VLLRPPAAVADAVTMVAGLAMAAGVETATGQRVGLKWPNDLVVPGGDLGYRKLGGILAEADWPARSQASGGWSPLPPLERVAVVVGIGVNCNWGDDVPAELADRLVALDHLTGEPVDRDAVLDGFLADLDRRYADLRSDGGRERQRADWRERSATLGRRVRIDLGSSDVEGVAVDVDDDGRLVVDTDTGERRTFAVGDVVHLR
jgi:BirA family biotin operon repressor/biotin-[acetyl-CoA-carboxylase] ligase